jgi:hypothetical protein
MPEKDHQVSASSEGQPGEELAACPFCGGVNIVLATYNYICFSCGAEGPDADRATISDVKAAWNRRAPAVPPNWKLVPVEPTEAMLGAFYSRTSAAWEDAYRAMLSASPPPPEAASQPDSVNEGSAGEVK